MPEKKFGLIPEMEAALDRSFPGWRDHYPAQRDVTTPIVYLAKRLLQADIVRQPYLFDDRLNDLSVAVYEYELKHGRIQTDIPEEESVNA